MTKDDWDKVFDIEVALRIIKHISSGIYRRPAGPLRELVSNSFDSQATRVTIDTGAPEFRTIRIRDDGLGMTRESVEKSFRSIGASQKVTFPERFGGNRARRLVGKFGIGILSCAHASRDILIQSFVDRDKPGLEVSLDLNPYFEFVNQVHPLDSFQFGTVKYRKLTNDDHRRGTDVILDRVDLREAFHAMISSPGESSVAWPSGPEQDSGQAMEGLVRKFADSGVLTMESLPGREQILWELGLMCPVEYLPDGPIADEFLNTTTRPVIRRLRDRAATLGFKLIFDGVEVRKPILLPTPKKVSSTVDQYDASLGEDVKVWTREFNLGATSERPVTATGYLLYQPNRVTPLELRGLYPRVSDVGIGGYENSFFKGIRTENPIFRVSVSGELYIDAGLDDALNLDRSGFMELDPEYRELQKAVFTWIGPGTSGEPGLSQQAKSASTARSKRRRGIKREIRKDEQERKTEHYAKRAGLSYAAHFESTPAKVPRGSPRPKPFGSGIKADYRSISAYPSGKRTLLLVNDSTKTVDMSPELDNPVLAGVILAAHRALGQSSRPAELRRMFADALASIV
ncbi:MAG: ATP-binding protein [Thermoplasmata archaeon]|nr:ATP-binding protein [Thermoplasmata archaeon]